MDIENNEIKATLQLMTDGGVISEEDIAEFFRTMKAKAGVTNLVEYLRKFKFERLASRAMDEAMLSGPVPYFPFTDLRPHTLRMPLRVLKQETLRMPGFTRFPYRKGAEILGHVSQVVRITFDKSDRYFFTGSDDGMLKLWEVKTGLLIHSFIGHKFCINDICTSSDNQILCSVDILGQLDVWNLNDFSLCFSMNVGQEVDFIEFISFADEDEADTQGSAKKDGEEVFGMSHEDVLGEESRDSLDVSGESSRKKMYHMVLVERRGVIRVITFTLDNIVSDHENTTINEFAGENPIQAVCITEGGGFLLCGGSFPFLIIFDLHSIRDNLLVFETEGYSVTFVIASRTSLKFAASTSFETVFLWEFQPDATFKGGNFKKRSKMEGCWRKTAIDLGGAEKKPRVPAEELNCSQMCFLADDRYLVCLCSDMKIRIYFNAVLVKVVEHSVGSLVPHPLENVFAVCNEKLEIFSLDAVLLTDTLTFTVIDSQFSVDGRHLVLCDEIGKIRIYAVDVFNYRGTPGEQFFASDFVHLNNTYSTNYYVECDNARTFDYAKNVNAKWVLKKFENRKIRKDARSMELERMGFGHLQEDFLDVKTFRKKYFVVDEVDESLSVSTLHSNEILTSEEYSGTEESAETVESAKANQRQVRRSSVQSILDEERLVVTSECSLESDFSLSDFTSSEEVVTRQERQRRSPVEMPGRRKKRRRIVHRPSAAKTSTGRTRRAKKSASAGMTDNFVEISDAARDYVRSWLLCTDGTRYFPQVNDKVRFIAERYREFLSIETRAEFEANAPERDADAIVTGVSFVKYDPCYAAVDLVCSETGAQYHVKYYAMRGARPIFVLGDAWRTAFVLGQTYTFAVGDALVSGKCRKVQRDRVEVEVERAAGEGRRDHSSVELVRRSEIVEMERADVFVESGEELPRKDDLVDVLERNKGNKMVYTQIRRNSNLTYDENVAYPLNFSVIQQRIRSDFYRSVAGLRTDLETMRHNSKFLPRGHAECVCGILAKIYALLDADQGRRRARRRVLGSSQ
jgi:WD40 repeat protein